jgi:hypothetical protein
MLFLSIQNYTLFNQNRDLINVLRKRKPRKQTILRGFDKNVLEVIVSPCDPAGIVCNSAGI